MNPRRTQRLAAIVALQLAGIFAGTQLGKIAPLVGWYQDDAGFSLVLIGWLTSVIGIFVALVALPAGWATERWGQRHSFAGASLLLVAGGLALALLQAPSAILAARLIEGLGYLIPVIAIPAILTNIALPSWRAPALAIWGGFVPLGFATADFGAMALVPAAGPQAYLAAATAGYALCALASAILLRNLPDFAEYDAGSSAPAAIGFAAMLTPAVMLVALAFGVYVILSVGFFAFMPAYFRADGAAMALSAGAVALLVPFGNVLAGLLSRGGSAGWAVLLAGSGFGLSAIAAVPAFAGAAVPSLLLTTAMAIFAIAGGLTASALFASISLLVRQGGSVSIAIGLVAQAGGIGTVVGPPLAGWIIDGHGFAGFGWFLATTGLAGALCVAALAAVRGRA